MRAIILAGGKSKRLKPLTNSIPKTLLPLAGKPILEHIMDAAYSNGLRHFDILSGFGHDSMVTFAESYKRKRPDVTIDLVYHDTFETTGNLVGFRYGEQSFNDDIVLINSDTIFHKEILANLLSCDHPNVMVVDDTKELGEEEMKVLVDEDGHIIKIHKTLPPHESFGEYVGILKFSADIKGPLIESLDRMIAEDNTAYYEDGLQKMIDEKGIKIQHVSTKGLPVMEIDTHEDLAEAKELIKQIET